MIGQTRLEIDAFLTKDRPDLKVTRFSSNHKFPLESYTQFSSVHIVTTNMADDFTSKPSYLIQL